MGMNPEEINQMAAEILRNVGFDPDARTRGTVGLREQLLSAIDLDHIKDPEWLIDKYIPKGGFVVLYGDPGSYKSFIAVDWALSVATGTKWGGWRVDGGPTLYIAAEGISGMNKRKRAWQEDRGVVVGENAKFLPVAVNLLDPLQAGELLGLVDEMRPSLVVIDTMARCLVGGDENSAKDVGRAVDIATELIRRTGCTVVVVHHTSKSGQSYRGSSALEGAADTMIRIEASESTVTFAMEKQKDAEKVEELNMTASKMSGSIVLKPLEGKASLREHELKLLSTLAECFLETEATGSQLVEASKVAGGSYYRAMNALLSKGFAVNNGSKSRPRYAITDVGTLQLTNNSPTTSGGRPKLSTTLSVYRTESGEMAGGENVVVTTIASSCSVTWEAST